MVASVMGAPVRGREWRTLGPRAEPPTASALRQRLAALGRPAGRNALALCLVLGAVYAGGLIRFAGIPPPDAILPSAALDFIRDAELKGNVFNPYGFGGFLIHAG